MQLARLLRTRRMTEIMLGFFLVSALSFGFFFFQHYRSSLTLDRLERLFVPGLHGVLLVTPNAEPIRFDPWNTLEQNRSLSSMLERLCEKAGLESSCATDPATRFQIFTTDHLVSYNGTQVALERNALPVPEDISKEYLAGRLNLIAEWAEKNRTSDGTFPYLYSPSRGEYPAGSNVIREMITVQGLYAIDAALGVETLTSIADRALAAGIKADYRSDSAKGYGYFADKDGEIKLGASALAFLAMREGKGDTEPLSDTEKRLAAFILSMQRDDGSFQTFLQDEPTDDNDRFYSGEALTAIARLAEITGEEKYFAALERSFPYYKAKLEEDFYPQYAPWHMQAYAIAYQATGREEYRDYTYWLADRLVETMLENDKDAQPDEDGRFYNPDVAEWGPPHSSSTGIYTEGLTYAYEIAKQNKDTKRMKKYKEAVLRGTRFLLTVQWTPESAYYLQYPDRVVGSFKRTITDNRHRVDQLGHAANALARVYSVVLE